MTYTRDEIMAMTAEQLRVAIAEKKGWRYLDDSTLNIEHGFWYTPQRKQSSCSCCPLPFSDYPHDIAAAWELVEEMARNGMLVTFQISRNVVSILVNTPIFDGSETIRVNDNSASTTISRAYMIWSEEVEA